jgi:acyl carrier protein
MAARVTPEDVLDLLVDGIRSVMALGDRDLGLTGRPRSAWREVRFDEDLHADSLDLVEVIEGVERALARRGVAVRVDDVELVRLLRVGDAADAIAASAAP